MLSLPIAVASQAQAQLLPSLPSTQPVSGVYVGAAAGVNWVQSTEDAGIKAKFDPGFGGVLAVGYGFANGLRLEVEGNYRQNDIDTIRGFTNTLGFGGTQRTYGVMVNALYELPFRFIVRPYIGGGVGYAWTEWDNVNVRFLNGARITADNEEGNFAYQGIVGTAFPLGLPGLSLTAEYRFFATLQNDFELRAVTAGGRRRNLGSFEADNFNHSVFVGVRYQFGQVAPAAPPAPAPLTPQVEAPRTYLVFFDWDRADLTDRARQIIGEAATNAGRTQTTRIEVAGHADRSGTPQYNQRLSQRRAENVAAELVRRGVPRNAITVTAFGESRPLVPTADGVREPQNRRVEIVLR
jgi:outer membrane protein OmpA-like peptidoglycan-associated protein/outer membrane protein W